MIAEADPKTRKARKTIAKKVAAMSLEQLQKELETKGLMKNGKKQIPEEMLRSIMRDALTLSEGK
jgi:predicted secreted Zn-dependent protease